MIEWNVVNVYLFAAAITSGVIILFYSIYQREGKRK